MEQNLPVLAPKLQRTLQVLHKVTASRAQPPLGSTSLQVQSLRAGSWATLLAWFASPWTRSPETKPSGYSGVSLEC